MPLRLEAAIFRDRRRLRRANLAADTQRNVHGPSALQVGHRDRLRHLSVERLTNNVRN
jgi:hypothetical protein